MTLPTGFLSGSGVFWASDNPTLRVRGEFSREGRKSQVTLEEGLSTGVITKPVKGGTALAVDPARVVEAFRPITLLGQLDSGETVSLLDARNHGGDGCFGVPVYQAHTVVVGALVSGSTQVYGALRVQFDDPIWLEHLTDGQSVALTDDGSMLRVEASDSGNWLLYESAEPAPLRDLRSRVETSCLTLARLVLDKNVTISSREARLDQDGEWLPVWGSERYADAGSRDVDDVLLPSEELTLERLAKWIVINDELDGLASAVVEPLTGPLQVQAQVATSLIEGLHRRLPYKQFHIDPIQQKKQLNKIQSKAKDAAGIQAETSGLNKTLVRKLVGQSLGHAWQVSFSERAVDVVSEVYAAVPEIVESLTDLPYQLTRARNDMAHHLQVDEAKEPLLQRYNRYMVIITITPWLLRGLLLTHVGIAPERLHSAYMSSERFGFARANVAELAGEIGWETTQSGIDQQR